MAVREHKPAFREEWIRILARCRSCCLLMTQFLTQKLRTTLNITSSTPRRRKTAHISSQLGHWNCRSHLLTQTIGSIYAQTNPLKPQKHNPSYLLCQFLLLYMPQLQGRRGFSGQVVLTMKVFVVLQGLITVTLLSGKSGVRKEGRESWDKEWLWGTIHTTHRSSNYSSEDQSLQCYWRTGP